MPLALDLFPDLDGLDGLIEESVPWLMAWAFVLALLLAAVLIAGGVARIRRHSPIDKLLRRRFG